MNWTPSLASCSSILGPTPQSRRTGSGARKAASCPGGTTTRPSGLRMSEAILATSLEVAMPTEAVSASSPWMVCLMARAMASPVPSARRLPVTSMKASSMEMGSTRSLKRPRISRTSRETVAYFAMSGGTYAPCGQRRQASEMGMAEATPKPRAS